MTGQRAQARLPPRALPARGRERILFLDGLRALSILWMISFHTLYFAGFFLSQASYEALLVHPLLTPFSQGHLGVEVFFVLSGYLITTLLFKQMEQDHRQSGRIRIGRFYLRRALRILPAYFLTLILGRLVLAEQANFAHAWANVLLLNNFLPVEQQALGWTWSLAIEEQFYLLLPLALWWTSRPDADPRAEARRQLPALLALLAAAYAMRAALMVGLRLQYPHPFHSEFAPASFGQFFDALYDKPYSRYGSLLCGVLTAYLERAGTPLAWLNDARRRRLTQALLVACCLGLVAYMTRPGQALLLTRHGRVGEVVVTTAYGYVFAGLIAYVVLYLRARAHAGQASRLGQLLSWRLWHPLAELAYSAYLLHPLVLIALWKAWERWFKQHPERTTEATTVLAVAVVAGLLSFSLALVMFKLVERPLRQWGRRLPLAGDAPSKPICGP